MDALLQGHLRREWYLFACGPGHLRLFCFELDSPLYAALFSFVARPCSSPEARSACARPGWAVLEALYCSVTLPRLRLGSLAPAQSLV